MSKVIPRPPHSPSLVAIGINHDTAPIQVREHFALQGERLVAALNAARATTFECVIISTCNRLELYALVKGDPDPEAVLTPIFGENSTKLRPYIYRYHEAEAARHLFSVASGINSLILGEVQILGQVQRAWQTAHKEGLAGPVLSQLFHKAVALGKRVHGGTDISKRPASVSYAAVVLAKQIFDRSLNTRRVLVIGTGEVGEGVARCLYEHGGHATVVAHRQVERAQDVARRYEADVATWDELPQRLAAADIVISSTAAPHTILQRRHIEEAMRERHGRPLHLIDLALPRDIDPSAAELPGVHLHNIDDLQAVVKSTLREREAALPAIQEMIDVETAKFVEWLRVRAAAPTIQEFQARAAEVIASELGWAMPKLHGLSERERQVVEAMAARIAGKLLHGPIQWLKAQASDGGKPDYEIDGIDGKEIARLFYGESSGGDRGDK